jgi:hypothetical protein
MGQAALTPCARMFRLGIGDCVGLYREIDALDLGRIAEGGAEFGEL